MRNVASIYGSLLLIIRVSKVKLEILLNKP